MLAISSVVAYLRRANAQGNTSISSSVESDNMTGINMIGMMDMDKRSMSMSNSIIGTSQ